MAKYNKKIAQRIVSLLRSDSYTVVEVCSMVNIAESTFYQWKIDKPEFSEMLKKAAEDRMSLFVSEAKKSLLKKIQGYTVEEKHTTMVDSKEIDPVTKNPKPKIKEQKIIKKHFQPDTIAIIFTLTNGEPEVWKNRQNNEVTGKGGKDLFASITDEELETKIADLKTKLDD